LTHKKFIKEYLSNHNYEIINGVLYIKGCLNLGGSNVKSLPDNLSIETFLSIRRTNISKLPNNLTTGSGLYMVDTCVRRLPDSIKIGGNIITGVQIEACEQLQLNLIKNRNYVIAIFKNPTEKAMILHKLLWKL